jgi:Ni,Fe-hydrogenase III large subunit
LLVDAKRWTDVGVEVAATRGQLVALWATPGDAAGGGANMRACFLVDGRLLVITLPMAEGLQPYAGLQELFPAAGRMQRAAFDLTGVRSDAADQRPWLRHAAWPADSHPLVGEPSEHIATNSIDDYPFVRVAGDGVHEVPVGPVHAGVIESGHFRFSIVGEKVLRLEERLGYVHKGIERQFAGLGLLDAHRLAARVSGDSAVAYSWAYCQAVEGLLEVTVPARALYLRALGLELERLQNHLGDLGALGNDAGFAFGLSQFSRLKEQCLRATHQALGSRYLFDFIAPGGTAQDIDVAGAAMIEGTTQQIAGKVLALREIYDEHTGLRDRFVGAGQVSAALARKLGLAGLAGRASGQALDLRTDSPWAPYEHLGAAKCVLTDGDVAARVALRFDELQESCRLIGRILKNLPDGGVRQVIARPNAPGFAVGLIEGWRGPVFIALQAGAGGAIFRCHVHDPSWQNWPALEHAIIGNIVPDFPLINKSFNLSYSGHDL